jgi:indolepyruvate ferredoxin oxidoreductase alpha subunit
MTGHQPHPGIGLTALGTSSKAIDIAEVVQSCGVEFVRAVDIDSLENSLESCVEAAKEAMNFKGPAVVVFKGKCAGLIKSDKRYKIDPESCTGCGFCIKQLGCPALFLPVGENKALAFIQDSCSGCGICAQICPSGAIRTQDIKHRV